MGTSDEGPDEAYRREVADLVAAEPRASDYRPAQPVELFIRARRTPSSLDDLTPIERVQLERMFGGDDLARVLRDGMAGEADEEYPLELELATVVDAQGTPLYLLYGMNYGAVFLMDANRVECVAFAAQHDLEHWHESQRALFWAMDGALRRNDHGFRQPMKFCWWDEKCWAEVAGKARGTVQSEPYIRKQFGQSGP